MEEALHHIENGLVKLFCDTIELWCVHWGGGVLNALLLKVLGHLCGEVFAALVGD
jgi:hypothetical protein